MRKFLLLDHDGVLVDTEAWYFAAGARALAEVGVTLDREEYLRCMARGLGTWAQAREAGVDESTIDVLRRRRDDYYQDYLRSEDVEIDGVADALAELAPLVRMAVVTTSKRADFELIHAGRQLTRHLEFVLVREDYQHAKPHPEPYLTGLGRFGARREDTLVVEDSARGLAAAVAAGIDCVVVHSDFTRSQDFSAASHRIDSLAGLKEVVLAGG